MRRFLVLISLLVLSITSSTSTLLAEVCHEYNLVMKVRGKEISSICFINYQDDGTAVGTIVNEFGVKAFDFTYDGKKTKVLNVIGPLDKWYIRKVLRKDFTFIIENITGGKDVSKGKRSMSRQPDGDIVVRNDKFNINYTFTPIKENNEAS